MPTTPNSQFYVVGGTVNPDSPSYVVRQADQELFDRVMAGDFCYVLTSRQMGKSSLMARAARRLSEAGLHTAIVDLTQIGTEKEKQSADQWYYGIAHRILRELQIRGMDLSQWWQSRQNLPALQRLMEFFSDLALEKIAGKVVVFIDEIDSTISLPFTDDFFAAIRACYNQRATKTEYNRLSFILLGVASPSDLVKDATRTPFNIGHRIELTDFTAEEARPLAAGLSANGQDGEQILARILDWTGGHPYLTQKLCGAMQSRDRDRGDGARDVDSLVEQNFLSQTASREDYNLTFVRDWMKGNKKFNIKVFRLYRRIRRGAEITDAPLSPVQNHLKLSGVVALGPDHTLHVRNHVYEHVFTAEWAKKAMPIDWNRRLAAASAAMLLLSIGFWYAVWNPRQFIPRIQSAMDDYPAAAYQSLHRYPWYARKADELMAQFWERRALRDEGKGRDEAVLERLQALASKPTEIRRKEASLLIGNDYPNLILTLRYRDPVYAVAFSPDGKRVLTGGGRKYFGGGEALQWDAQTGQPLGEPLHHGDSVTAVVYSLDGKRVLTGSQDGTARQWDAQTGQPLGEPLRHNDSVSYVAYSLDGKRALTFSRGSRVARLWDAQAGQLIGEPLRRYNTVYSVYAVAFSPDGKRVLTGSADGTARMWDAETGQQIGDPFRHGAYVSIGVFSPDGKRALTGSFDCTVRVWDAASGQQIGDLLRHGADVSAVAFSSDGKQALTGSSDGTARVWGAATDKQIGDLSRDGASVSAVAFSPDGKRALTGGRDGMARVWDAATGQQIGDTLRHDNIVYAVAYSPDGKRALTGSGDGMARLWDLQTGQKIREIPRQARERFGVLVSSQGVEIRPGDFAFDVAFSPDGKRLVTWLPGSHNEGPESNNATPHLWDTQTGQQVGNPLYQGDNIYAVAFSPDGKRALTGSFTGKAWVWDAQTGQQIGGALRLGDSITAIALSLDGKRVLTGSLDGTVRLWSAQTGQQMGAILRTGDYVIAVAFSPDGKRVLIQTPQWLYLSDVDNNGLKPIASRFFSKMWKGGYHFLDNGGNHLQVARSSVADSLKIEIVRFEAPEAEPLLGDPAELLRDWQRKLGLKFDPSQNQKLVSIYPIEIRKTMDFKRQRDN